MILSCCFLLGAPSLAQEHQHGWPPPAPAAPQAVAAAPECPEMPSLKAFHEEIHPRLAPSSQLCPTGPDDAAGQRNFHDVCGAKGKISRAPFWGYFVKWAEGRAEIVDVLGDYEKKYFILRYGQTQNSPEADSAKAQTEAYEMWTREPVSSRLAALWVRQVKDEDTGKPLRIGGWPRSRKAGYFQKALESYDQDLESLDGLLALYAKAQAACQKAGAGEPGAAKESESLQAQFKADHASFLKPSPRQNRKGEQVPAASAAERLAAVLGDRQAQRFRQLLSDWPASFSDWRARR
jgi:hypothetical protein